MGLWLIFWFIPLYDQTERIILFAAFVVVPLTLFRVVESATIKPVIFLKIIILLIPIGALSLAGSFSLSPGIISGLLAIPWSFVTFAIAALGVVLFVNSSVNLANLSKAIGFMYISLGGIWLVAHQFAFPLLGFKGQIMLLTVNHFHYAGFVAPVLFGFLHESQQKRAISRIIVILGGISPILIALGMTYSSILEWIAVVTFASSLILYSTLIFIYVLPTARRWTKAFHILSSGVIWITITLAITYGFGEWIGQPTISISTMILFHGWGNAVVFSFIGVLAWHATMMDKASGQIPFSRIQGKGKIGSNVFINLAVLDRKSKQQPTGLIDNMQDYKSKSFNPELLDQDIIDFYEHTKDYELLLTPHWSRSFQLLANVYKLLSQRIEQMNFPLKAETKEQQVQSTILPICDDRDGRRNVRSWVRTYSQSNKAIYAALYSTHVSEHTRYMNIAFPLPFSQMTSILCLHDGSDDKLVLTSWQTEKTSEDQGVYLVYNQQAIRLPINETITVWKEKDSPKGTIEAKHDMWLFGKRFLTLDYHIYKENFYQWGFSSSPTDS